MKTYRNIVDIIEHQAHIGNGKAEQERSLCALGSEILHTRTTRCSPAQFFSVEGVV